MKRLIAISVVFALVAGAAFAVDLGGEVIGTVDVVKGQNVKEGPAHEVGAGAKLNRIRLQGDGANDDGTFGGWIRAEANGWYTEDHPMGYFYGYAWWKPIDQLKIWIGGNGGDGFFAKEGQTAWMFYQRASDTGVVDAGNAWGSAYTSLTFRHAFYGGGDDGGNAFYATISPAEIVDINIEVPFWSEGQWGGEGQYIYKRTIAQLDFKLDFGNIALTYKGNLNDTLDLSFVDLNTGVFDLAGIKSTGSQFFAYFGLSSIENLGIDVGIGFTLPVKNDEIDDVTVTYLAPVAAGLGVQYGAGAFGVKARVAASFAGNVKVDMEGAPDDSLSAAPLNLLFDILPYYALNDNFKIFFSAGLGITGKHKVKGDWVDIIPDVDGKTGKDGIIADSVVGWHINPYVWIGQEWGPSFWAGLLVQSTDGIKEGKVTWAVPIALGVSF